MRTLGLATSPLACDLGHARDTFAQGGMSSYARRTPASLRMMPATLGASFHAAERGARQRSARGGRPVTR